MSTRSEKSTGHSKRKAIGYARLSTKKQEKGSGYQRQEESIQKFADANNYELIYIQRECCSRSVKWWNRPELPRIVQDCVDNDAVLLVESPDRLTAESLPVPYEYTSPLARDFENKLQSVIDTYKEALRNEVRREYEAQILGLMQEIHRLRNDMSFI